MFRFSFLLVSVLLSLPELSGQESPGPQKLMESFEDGIPPGLYATGREISIDSLRMKQGDYSLKWKWEGNDELIFDTPIGYRKQCYIGSSNEAHPDGHGGSEDHPVLEPPRGFFLWVYNDQARKQRIRVQFGRDEQVDCEFDFNLNFKGWRTMALTYDRGDMRGVPREDMTRMTIHAPATGSGTFHFDVLGFAVAMNPRTVNANPQLPEIDRHPRLVAQYPHLLFEYSKLRPTFSTEPLTEEMIRDFRTLEMQVSEFWLPPYEKSSWKEEEIEGIREKYKAFGITRDGDQIYGRPLVKANIMTEYFIDMKLPGNEMLDGIMRWRQEYSEFLLKLAKAHRWTSSEDTKRQLEEMFINLFDYGVDQGFDEGAGLGWIHHYSYIIREIAPAFFIMKELLKEHQRLEKAIGICKWFYSFNQVYSEDMVYDCKDRKGINADEAQGLLLQRLTTALLMEDGPEKARDLQHYSSYFSNVVTEYAQALDETFKPDGTIFHHAGHAFSYGGRAIYGTVATLYALSGTSFSATTEASLRMQKVTEVLNYCLFTDLHMAPKAFASIRFSNYALPEKYVAIPALLALSDPDLNYEMASLYLEILDQKEEISSQQEYWLEKIRKHMSDVGPYFYDGIKLLPYSCVAVKRQQNEWMITVRAHSKYVYPFESWGPSFFAYPLFIANGYLDVSYPKDLDSPTPTGGSTWHKGYDWHRWPGVTSVHLPYKNMLSSPGQIRDEGGEYLLSDQSMSGGVESSDGNGVFVFQFKGHDKYGIESFTGRKSYFFYNDKVLCLGTNIRSDIDDQSIETTLFQSKLDEPSSPIQTSLGAITTFPYQDTIGGDQSFWAIDSRGTGYYLPAHSRESPLILKRKTQNNPDKNGKAQVSGDFATAWIDHGEAPENEGYEYILMAGANPEKMEVLSSAMNGRKPPVNIIRMDDKAHVIDLKEIASTAYAVYHKNGLEFNKGLVKKVNRPSTFILRKENGNLRLSLSDPDLNIYDGQDDLMPDGTRCELSIYEREWFYWPSRSTFVQITLKGNWSILAQSLEMETALSKKARIIQATKNETTIEFECRDGLSAEILLGK